MPKYKVLITQEQLQKRIQELAQEIKKEYDNEDLILIAVLSGSLYFLADLTRQLPCNQKLAMAVVSSYAGMTKPQYDAQIEYENLPNIENKHVLMIDDIFDTGRTLDVLQSYILKKKPKSLKAAVLLNKQTKHLYKTVDLAFVGFEIPDEFVIGYGLDYEGKYRNLPFVATI